MCLSLNEFESTCLLFTSSKQINVLFYYSLYFWKRNCELYRPTYLNSFTVLNLFPQIRYLYHYYLWQQTVFSLYKFYCLFFWTTMSRFLCKFGFVAPADMGLLVGLGNIYDDAISVFCDVLARHTVYRPTVFDYTYVFQELLNKTPLVNKSSCKREDYFSDTSLINLPELLYMHTQ